MPLNNRPAHRLFLAQAKRAAHAYDGSEDSYDHLIDSLSGFERMAAAAYPGLPGFQAERTFAADVGSLRPVSVNDLLDVAARQYERKFVENRLAIKISPSPLIFLPTDGQSPVQPGPNPETAFEAPRIEPRTKRFLATLTAPGKGVFLDDLIIHTGAVQRGAMRTEAYALIQLPRHDREVLICDQVGNASFVGKGVRGPIFWASYRKDQLERFADVARVVNGPGSDARMIDLIVHDNPILPKAIMGGNRKPPLSDDIVLIYGLRHAEADKGHLPTRDSEAVIGLSGEIWLNWDQAYKIEGRGLGRDGITGISHLFQVYGLKNGRKENPVAVAQAIETLNTTGHHGLKAGALDAGQISEDTLLTDALRHAEKNNLHLPHPDAGEVDGSPGQNWTNREDSLRNRSRGLTREGVKSLGHFYQIFGLKIGRVQDREKIAGAIRTLNETGHHGLVAAEPDTGRLTEDMILTHALRYAEKNHGKLPNKGTPGDVEGLPGQAWTAWDQCVKLKLRGLERDDMSGMVDLFRVYGLKTGRKENPEVVAAAIRTLNETGHHGLRPIIDPASAIGTRTVFSSSPDAAPP